MNNPVKVTTRSLRFESMQWGLTDDYDQVGKVIDWVVTHGGTASYNDEKALGHLRVETLDGTVYAKRGWYILREITDEPLSRFHVVSPNFYKWLYMSEDEMALSSET